MLDKIILYSLKSRLLIVSLSAFILVYGYQIVKTLPIDVFPDLSPPTVTIISEVEGLAPEEIETTVTLPIELAMNGANSVKSVRSSSSIGFSIVYVEFNWNTEIFKARQIVIEKLNQVSSVLPKDVNTVLGPVSSIMGEVMFIGITSSNKTKLSSIELRTIAEWDIKQNLLGISGISKITAIGGDLKQYHVLINPDKLINFGVTIHQVQEALENANINTTGGFLKDSYKEYSIRNVGRISSLDDLKKTVIAKKVSPEMPSLTLADIAEIKISGPVTKRGDASINGKAGILLAISKQPGTDTIKLTKDINIKKEYRNYFFKKDIVKLVYLLDELDEDKYTKHMLRHLANDDVNSGSEILAAELATSIERFDFAIQISKIASYEKRFHNKYNYPIISTPKYINGRKIPESAFILSIIRQESEFDLSANSHAGAKGLMQLMPYTAKLVAKQAKLPYSRSRLTTDPEYNINLGSHYIAGLILEYDGAYPFAVAAYNAGPKRVRYWKKINKDPQKGQTNYIDWIELIKFKETRNYVQRVLENYNVYRYILEQKPIPMKDFFKNNPLF